MSRNVHHNNYMHPVEVPNYLDVVASIRYKYISNNEYLGEMRKGFSAKQTYVNVEQITGNLFTSDSSWALAHCVSEDLSVMSTEFKRRFGVPSILREQPNGIGFTKVAYILNQIGEGRFIFYLQTKRAQVKKSPYLYLYCCFRRMKLMCFALNHYQVAISRVGCGLDKLDFNKVFMLINIIFKNSGIRIKIYSDIEAPGIFHATGYKTDMNGEKIFDAKKLQKSKDSSPDGDNAKDAKELANRNIREASNKIELIEITDEEGVIDLTIDSAMRII